MRLVTLSRFCAVFLQVGYLWHGAQDFNQVDIKEGDPPILPEKTSILYNYPNPFNARTQILFRLSQKSDTKITIYDILGRKIETLDLGFIEAGAHSVSWNARGLSSGVYFYQIQAGEYTDLHKCILLK